MALTELQAKDVMLVRAIEQARDGNVLWSPTDAKDATRASIELIGQKASYDQFIARRAEWVLDAIRKRQSEPLFDLAPRKSPTVAAWLLIVSAFVIGFATNHLAADSRVNIVEYPLVGLILWNLLVFITILVSGISNLFRLKSEAGGPLTDLLGQWQLWGAIKSSFGKTTLWGDQFKSDWCMIAASLNQQRLALTLHAASILFALGAMGSLYIRGFFKEYRAGWESTFFSAESIHAIANVVLAPGALLLNMQMPDVAHVAGLRFPESAGEIARDWIHLYAASILLWILVPRLVLAIASGFSKWRQQRSFPLPIRNTYFAALRAIHSGKGVDVVAIPFRYELTSQVKADLVRLLERAHGLAVSITVQEPVLMGEEAADWKTALGNDRHIAVFVIFNLAATAESDTHGLLVKKILGDVYRCTPVIPIVDTGSYVDRDKDRFNERCNQWRNILDRVRCKPLFLNLLTTESTDVQLALQNRLYEYD